MIKALKMTGKVGLLVSILLTAFVAQAKPSAKTQVKTSEALNAVAKKYRETKMVEMVAEKTIKSDLLGKETVYKGFISLAGGKFRWENTTPEETLLVFDGTNIWSVQIPPKEFGGAVQVAHGKVDKKTKSQILISSLLGKEPVSKNFKVLKEEKTGDIVKVQVAPQGSDLTVKTLDLVIDAKEKTLTQISYLDDVNNLTTMKFSKIQFLKKEDKKRFQYQPPKGAQESKL